MKSEVQELMQHIKGMCLHQGALASKASQIGEGDLVAIEVFPTFSALDLMKNESLDLNSEMKSGIQGLALRIEEPLLQPLAIPLNFLSVQEIRASKGIRKFCRFGQTILSDSKQDPTPPPPPQPPNLSTAKINFTDPPDLAVLREGLSDAALAPPPWPPPSSSFHLGKTTYSDGRDTRGDWTIEGTQLHQCVLFLVHICTAIQSVQDLQAVMKMLSVNLVEHLASIGTPKLAPTVMTRKKVIERAFLVAFKVLETMLGNLSFALTHSLKFMLLVLPRQDMDTGGIHHEECEWMLYCTLKDECAFPVLYVDFMANGSPRMASTYGSDVLNLGPTIHFWDVIMVSLVEFSSNSSTLMHHSGGIFRI
ncbi:hypothetical protein Sjap_008939 [Stephania japonica]|uniref:Uncharacterized protein n=1 Tax=Stephania japonica TaxID=461633 RepID=A0AAP0JST6_9MAGN